MTRQEEWEKQEAITAKALAPRPVSQTTGRHKRNTRDRGDYNGYTTREVVRLINKKKKYIHSKTEIKAMVAYFDERLANGGESMSKGVSDGLKYGGVRGKNAKVDPFMPCGSIECRPDKQI